MNDVESAPEQYLVPFHAALEQRKESVAVQVAARLRVHVPSFVLPTDEVELAAREMVAQFLDAVLDPSAQKLREATDLRIKRMFVRGLPPANVHALSAELREVLLDVGMELRRIGVPGATNGIRRLIAASRISVQMVDDAFRQRTSEILQTAKIFEALFQAAPYAVVVALPDNTVRFSNPKFQALLGLDDLVGRSIESLHDPDDIPRLRGDVRPTVSTRGQWDGPLRYKNANGSLVETHATVFRLQNSSGEVAARCAIIRELEPERRAEEERRKLMEEVIEAQARALEERQTPLVPIANGILVMPIIGTIDAKRANRMITALLQGIDEQHASVVLLDLTGMRAVDASSTNAIVQAVQAARLLGTDVVLTGIEPNVAQLFVDANADFSGIEIKGTLGDGVRWALRKMRQK